MRWCPLCFLVSCFLISFIRLALPPCIPSAATQRGPGAVGRGLQYRRCSGVPLLALADLFVINRPHTHTRNRLWSIYPVQQIDLSMSEFSVDDYHFHGPLSWLYSTFCGLQAYPVLLLCHLDKLPPMLSSRLTENCTLARCMHSVWCNKVYLSSRPPASRTRYGLSTSRVMKLLQTPSLAHTFLSHRHQADNHIRSRSPLPLTLHHSRCAPPPSPNSFFACCPTRMRTVCLGAALYRSCEGPFGTLKSQVPQGKFTLLAPDFTYQNSL